MSRMGQDLVEAMQEALEHSEGRIELKTSRLVTSPVCNTSSTDSKKEPDYIFVKEGASSEHELDHGIIHQD